MAYVTPGTVAAGDVATAAAWNVLAGNDIVIASTWTQFTPVATNLTIGNGTLTSVYLNAGRLIVWRGVLTWGSTTTATSSITTLTLPVERSQNITGTQVGSTVLQDTSLGNIYNSVCYSLAATTLVFYHSTVASNNGTVNGTSPFTWASTDFIRWTIVYEAA